MTPRDEVYVAIDSERNYQNWKWGDPPHEIDAFACYISGYTNKLIELCSTTDSSERLDIIRKIAGLCVVCMEQHGSPMRAIPQVYPSPTHGIE